jgi:excisionase family DNA binding protein
MTPQSVNTPAQDTDALAAIINAIRQATQLPLKDTLWTVSDVAEYLSVSVSTARKLTNQPRFPRARQPGGGHSRWVAAEVVEWAKK